MGCAMVELNDLYLSKIKTPWIFSKEAIEYNLNRTTDYNSYTQLFKAFLKGLFG